MVASVQAFRRRDRLGWIAAEPAVDVVFVELLGPDQAGHGLALHESCVRIGDIAASARVKDIGFPDARCDQFVEAREGIARRFRGVLQAATDCDRVARQYLKAVMDGCLGAGAVGVHRLHISRDQVLVEGVLEVPGTGGGRIEEERAVGFVVGEEERLETVGLRRTVSIAPPCLVAVS